MIYTGQQDSIANHGHAQAVVMNLLDGLEECYRTVVVDNFVTSISLAKHLLEHDTYLIGTLRSNPVGSESKVLQKTLDTAKLTGFTIKMV